MKKKVSYFLILNLFLSIVAFSFILNIGFVFAKEGDKWIDVNGVPTELDTPQLKKAYEDFEKFNSESDVQNFIIKKLQKSASAKPPSSLPVPSHGYAGKGYESLFGKGTTAPKGTEIPVGEGVDKAFTASGAGYSTAGILQGAAWAVAVVGAVQFIAPFAGANSQQTNSISAAMGVGTFTGTTVKK